MKVLDDVYQLHEDLKQATGKGVNIDELQSKREELIADIKHQQADNAVKLSTTDILASFNAALRNLKAARTDTYNKLDTDSPGIHDDHGTQTVGYSEPPQSYAKSQKLFGAATKKESLTDEPDHTDSEEAKRGFNPGNEQ
jgi:hypothetical protein